MDFPPNRPWQRPPQKQHGYRDNTFGDAEATGALLARMAAVRAWEEGPARSTSRQPRSGALVGVPFEASAAHDAAAAYLGLLDRILQDRVITETEVRSLRHVATEWGIGALEADRLHRSYVAGVLEEAQADGTITLAEIRDIKLLAKLLGVPVAMPREGTQGRARLWIAVPIEADAKPDAPVPGRNSLPRRPASGDPGTGHGGDATTPPRPEHSRG